MIELKGNIWEQTDSDAICITTNGVVIKTGENVMGAGIALQARLKFPSLPSKLGERILNFGNQVYVLSEFKINDGKTILISFPTKEHWKEDSSIELIEKSAKELKTICDTTLYGFKRIVMPKPGCGCGCGHLNWSVVKPVLEKYLDDRFIVIYQ